MALIPFIRCPNSPYSNTAIDQLVANAVDPAFQVFFQPNNFPAGTAPASYIWTTTGSLPPGLSTHLVGNGSIEVTGTPTTAGVFTTTFQVTVGAQSASGTYLWKVLATTPTVYVGTGQTADSDVSAVVGQVYYFPSLAYRGGSTSTPTWTATGLPPGMIVESIAPYSDGANVFSGAIIGAPTAPGVYNAILTATGTAGDTATMYFVITVTPDQAFLMQLPAAPAGSHYSFQFDQTFGDSTFVNGVPHAPAPPYTYLVEPFGGIPAGWTLTSGGLLQGVVPPVDNLNQNSANVQVKSGGTTAIVALPFFSLPAVATGQAFHGTHVGFFSAGKFGGGNL